MIGNFIGMMVNGAKTLLGKKSTQNILKYLATVTLNHAATKYKVNQYKYDPMDMKNMIYHHNLNNNNTINKNDVDLMTDIMNICRFMNEFPRSEIVNDPMTELISNLTQVMNDTTVSNVYNNMLDNNVIQQFDTDTLETSSIADNYEISSGGIYLPDRNVMTSTIEGCNLANAKNEYLEKRIELGENPPIEKVQSLLTDYYDKINFENVLQYFNS